MFNIALVEPEIHTNTGNISRTCAVTGSRLHLVEPLGFDISDRAVRRAGLDYWPLLDLTVYPGVDVFFERNEGARFWLLTTKGQKIYDEADFCDGDFLVFGKETAGLPSALLEKNPERCLRIPMLPVEGARSLNLSNSVAVVLYEALRQTGFSGLG